MRVVVLVDSDAADEPALIKTELDRLLGDLDKKKLTVLVVQPPDATVVSWCDKKFLTYEVWHPEVKGREKIDQTDEMIVTADALIAFWDSTPKTKKHMDAARKLKIKVRVVQC